MKILTNTESLEVLKSAKGAINRTFRKYGRTPTICNLHDISTDALIKVMENYDPTIGALRSIAYCYAQNIAIDFLRGRKYAGGSKEVTPDEDPEADTSFVESFADSTPSALASMIHAEKQDMITDAFQDLKEHEKDAIRADFSETVMTGAQRVAKSRAVAKMREMFATK